MCREVIVTPDLYKINDRRTVTQEFPLEDSQINMGLKESKLRDKKVQKLSEKTGFDHDEIYKWHAGFMKDSPTGEMQLSEFIAIYRELFPNGDATKFSTYIFNVIDQDGSGSISFEEFMMVTFKSQNRHLHFQALSVISPAVPIDAKLEWAFGLYDLDNSGSISRDEIYQVYESIYSLVCNSQYFQQVVGSTSLDERVDRIFDLMDEVKERIKIAVHFRSLF